MGASPAVKMPHRVLSLQEALAERGKARCTGCCKGSKAAPKGEAICLAGGDCQAESKVKEDGSTDIYSSACAKGLLPQGHGWRYQTKVSSAARGGNKKA